MSVWLNNMHIEVCILISSGTFEMCASYCDSQPGKLTNMYCFSIKIVLTRYWVRSYHCWQKSSNPSWYLFKISWKKKPTTCFNKYKNRFTIQWKTLFPQISKNRMRWDLKPHCYSTSCFYFAHNRIIVLLLSEFCQLITERQGIRELFQRE